MDDTSNTLWVGIISASSAIIAVVLTQVITAYNNRKSDQRKEITENKRASLKKKIEIGENFYHMFRESSLNLHRFKAVFVNEKSVETVGGHEKLLDQRNRIQERATQLVADTRLWNLTDIYFDIESDSQKTNEDVVKMFDLETRRMELVEKFTIANEYDSFEIAKDYSALCDVIIVLINDNISRVERDLILIKTELIRLSTLA